MTNQLDLVARLQLALRQCRNQFAFYAEQHRAKRTKESDDKAVVNDGYVQLCEQALALPPWQGAVMVWLADAPDEPRAAVDAFFMSGDVLPGEIAHVEALGRVPDFYVYQRPATDTQPVGTVQFFSTREAATAARKKDRGE